MHNRMHSQRTAVPALSVPLRSTTSPGTVHCLGSGKQPISRRQICDRQVFQHGTATAGCAGPQRRVGHALCACRPRRVVRAAADVPHAAPVPPPSSSRPAAADPFLTVVLPNALALMLCNMDRVCLSVAIMPMSKELGWPVSLQGIIQSAFLWGYVATQLLGGTLADRHGGKLIMAVGVLIFSIASLMLPLATSAPVAAAGLTIPAVLATRCLVGMGEGVALPSMSNLLATHIPKASRARALGLASSGFHSGTLLGFVLSPFLLLNFGWRWLFATFGLLGAPVLAIWMAVVPAKAPAMLEGGGAQAAEGQQQQQQQRGALQQEQQGSPQLGGGAAAAGQEDAHAYAQRASSGQHAGSSGRSGFLNGVGAAGFRPVAAAFAASVPPLDAGGMAAGGSGIGVRELLSHSATWAIIIVTIVNNWGYFIYNSWMPSYFSSQLGFDLRASAVLSLLPWTVMLVGCSAAGVIADHLVSRGMPIARVRKLMQSIAFLIPTLALLVLAQPGIRPGVAVAAITVALGTTSFGLAGYVANMSDIAPQHAGQMYGLCSTFGSMAGIISVTAAGFIVEATRSFAAVFLLTAGLYVAGTIAWNVMCVGERVF